MGPVLPVLLGKPPPVGGSGPLVVRSALGVIVAAGDVIRLYRQSILGLAWLALLLLPPATVIAASILLPWTLGICFEVDRPACAMSAFFTDTLHRCTGAPLRIVAVDAD